MKKKCHFILRKIHSLGFYFLVPLISIVGMVSCNNVSEGNAQNSDSTVNQSDQAFNDPAMKMGMINDDLKYLLMPRDTFLAIANTRRNPNEKMAFQFAVEDTATGDLTLGAYGQKASKFSIPYFLEVGRGSNESIEGKKVRFSTQKLIKQNVQTLVSYLGDTSLKYLLFKPAYDESNYTVYYIIFPITAVQKTGYTDPGITLPKIDTIMFVPINTNPSPPASSKDDEQP